MEPLSEPINTVWPGKATVLLGDVSRGGYTRGDHRACDHDLGLKESERSQGSNP